MWITNRRSLTTDLGSEGFVLVCHASSVVDFDLIQADAVVRSVIDEAARTYRLDGYGLDRATVAEAMPSRGARVK